MVHFCAGVDGQNRSLVTVNNCSDGNFSRGVEEAIPMMGIDCKPCGRNATLYEEAHLGWIKDLTLWP